MAVVGLVYAPLWKEDSEGDVFTPHLNWYALSCMSISSSVCVKTNKALSESLSTKNCRYPIPSACHSRENGDPDVVPANPGNQKHNKLGSCFHRKPWIPASAGMMTGKELPLRGPLVRAKSRTRRRILALQNE